MQNNESKRNEQSNWPSGNDFIEISHLSFAWILIEHFFDREIE